MNKTIKRISAVLAVAVMLPLQASAWDLKDVLGDSGLGQTVGNMIEGVFTKTNLDVSDIVGEWTADGSAVTFKSDNMLKKAGGVAAAAAIEAKLDPYYKQYGLTGAVLTVSNDSTFTLAVKRLKLSGTLASNGDGTFRFNFTVMGKVKIGDIDAFVQKSGSNLDVMFDATKLKNLVSAVAQFSGMSMAKTFAGILEGYDGLCVGFGMHKTGDAPSADGVTGKSAVTKSTKSTGTKSTGTKSSSSTKSGKSSSSKSSSSKSAQSALESLGKLLKN